MGCYCVQQQQQIREGSSGERRKEKCSPLKHTQPHYILCILPHIYFEWLNARKKEKSEFESEEKISAVQNITKIVM